MVAFKEAAPGNVLRCLDSHATPNGPCPARHEPPRAKNYEKCRISGQLGAKLAEWRVASTVVGIYIHTLTALLRHYSRPGESCCRGGVSAGGRRLRLRTLGQSGTGSRMWSTGDAPYAMLMSWRVAYALRPQIVSPSWAK